jgi:hypothetical protein
MNIVFLDIDGVLNNLGSVVGLGNPSKFFDPVSVALVDKLCKEGDASIVVSSSWRCGNPESLRADLIRCGAIALANRVVGETPDLSRDSGACRGDEIAAWLDGHVKSGRTLGRFVVLDDDGDILNSQPFVKTTFEDGFRFKHYIAALRHLNPTHRDCNDRAVIVPETTGDSER